MSLILAGDLALSPSAGSYYTGFSEALSGDGTYSTSTQVVGKLYAASYNTPTPSVLTTVIGDITTAYNNGASRISPDYLNLNSGSSSFLHVTGISHPTPVHRKPCRAHSRTGTLQVDQRRHSFTSLHYLWYIDRQYVVIPFMLARCSEFSLFQAWIFQITGSLGVSANKIIILANGALPKNIFWVVSGAVNIGAGASFPGIILAETSVTFQTGSSLSGRILSQTAVALASATIVAPP